MLIPGGFILTAAHCLEWDSFTVLDSNSHKVTVRDLKGREFVVSPYVVEACQDIAVLGTVDEESNPNEANKFADFLADTLPVKLGSHEPIPYEESLEVRVYNLDRSWVNGEFEVSRKGQPTGSLLTSQVIISGASGGPVVTSAGELIGIMSNSSGSDGTGDDEEGVVDEPFFSRRGRDWYVGSVARPLTALPVWVLAAIYRFAAD